MPRKKKAESGAVAVVETDSNAAAMPSTSRPSYIDGAPVDEEGRTIKDAARAPDGQMDLAADAERGKNWGPPYKAVFTTKDFELGENRRYKQRVFTFGEKPSAEITAALKDAGFTYRANEKAWTIQADAATRVLSDDLARQFAGKDAGMSL